MKLHKSLTLFLLLSISLLVSSMMVTGQEQIQYQKTEGKITLSTDILGIEIVGNENVPSFYYWQVSNDSVKYRVYFDQFFEINDTNENGVFDAGDTKYSADMIGLASLGWTFSDFIVNTDENGSTSDVNFNMTTSAPNGQGPNQDINFTLQFNFHLYANNPNEIKFDVIISDYIFQNENSLLVIGFKIKTEDQLGENDIGLKGNGTMYSFGDAYFGSNLTATDNGTNCNVGLSSAIENLASKIYLTYPQFTGMLVHDPVLGVTPDYTAGTDETTDQKLGPGDNYLNSRTQLIPDLSKGALVAATLIGSGIFLAIPLLVTLKRIQK